MDTRRDQEQPLLYEPAIDNRRPKRQGGVACLRCAAFTTFSLVFLFFLSILGVLVYQGWTALRNAQHPHKSLWYDSAKHNKSLPVINYLGRDDLFDIGVTVWLLPTEVDIARNKQIREASSVVDSAPRDSDLADKDRLQPNDYGFIDSPAIPLYSDIVFRNATMTSKHLLETVNFSLPIARFCGLNVSNSDLKAAFVLIPHRGGLLDKANKWSSVVPDWMTKSAVRPWPFPLGALDIGPKSMRDEIIEAGAIVLPLIRFNNPPAPLKANTTSSTASATGADTITGNLNTFVKDEDDDDDEDGDSSETDQVQYTVINGVYHGPVTKHGKKPSGSRWANPELVRPYVISRTQLRVIDSAAQYSLEGFNKQHRQYKDYACTAADAKWRLSKLAHENCHVGWDNVGPFGLRVTLDADLDNDGRKTRAQRTYGPSLSVKPKSYGPQDLVKIPVNRTVIDKDEDGVYTPLGSYEECTSNLTAIDIAWRISFSGRTPVKAWLADKLNDFASTDVAHNATELNKASQQDTHVLFDGLAGHKHNQNSHPRRRFALWLVQSLLSVILWFGSLYYWYSIRGTIGLATKAWCVIGATDILLPTAEIVRDVVTHKVDPVGLFGILPAGLVVSSPALLMLKNTSRLECTWTGPNGRQRTIPRLRRRPANHLERASDRVEAAIPLRNILLAGSAILLVYSVRPASNIFVIQSSLPAFTFDDRSKTWKTDRIFLALHNALVMTSRGVQLSVNFRRKRWAGDAKWVVKGAALSQLLGVVGLSRLVTGHWEHFPGFTVDAALELGFAAAEAAQAWLYAGGEEDDVEEDK